MEGAIFPVYKNGYSLKPLAETLEKRYDLENQGYVMNQLLEYRNIYGLNFYLGNTFKNFVVERPTGGFLVTGEKTLEKVRKNYSGQYRFVCQIVKL
ncbi:MAG: hypothetical protein NTY32_02030 [Bacteroidia bacterium]|nr:hypothetical protein [Bacteroidia bacterium]